MGNRNECVIRLNNGTEMPRLGFGVFQITDEKECRESVLTALRAGYRLIDTAACYGNERAVGEAVRESGISRQEVFLTSKVWIQDAGYEKTKRSFQKTLENLGTDYLDLAPEDMVQISRMDSGKSQILKIRSLAEVYRLYNIRFVQ